MKHVWLKRILGAFTVGIGAKIATLVYANPITFPKINLIDAGCLIIIGGLVVIDSFMDVI